MELKNIFHTIRIVVYSRLSVVPHDGGGAREKLRIGENYEKRKYRTRVMNNNTT